MSGTSTILAFAFPLRLEYMTLWQAGLLFVAVGAPIWWMAARSLAGLGPVRRWVALGVRLLVLLLLILIIGGVRWQRENKIVEVMVLRDVSESTSNVTRYPGKSLQLSVDRYLGDSSDAKHKPPDDRVGLISFSSTPLIDAIPNTSQLALDTNAIREPGRGTDAASAIQLALATLGKDAMHRLVLIWDGNATTGDLDAALAAAAAQHVQIDVMPLHYDVKNEVLVDRFIAPTWKRENEPFTIDVILRSTNPPVSGKLTVTHNGQPMDMDPATPGIQSTRSVVLKQERNVEHIFVPPMQSNEGSIHQFRAIFEAPTGAAVNAEIAGAADKNRGAVTMVGDTLTQNNTADAFTFVHGKGRILYVNSVPENNGEVLRKALENQGITLQTIGVEQFPRNLVEMQNYDAVILANVNRGAGGLGDDEEKMLASYVHDMGGGLVMIGGENTFGAGGWQGSKLEEVLPVNMDIPAQRQMPKGALVLIMHSCEMPRGNYWGEQCAIKAIEALSSRDEIGVISYDWNRAGPPPFGGGGSQWDFPLAPKGDGSKVISAVKAMKLGDMPSFHDSMDVALNGANGEYCLAKSDARQKHVIIISDGDPQKPLQALIDAYVKAKVSVSTVAVYPHDRRAQGLPPTMREIAEELKGRAYGPVESNPDQLPQIFIKEATVVRRSLIYEDKNGIPVKQNMGSASELIKGLGELPNLYGLVLTSKKEDPQIEMPLVTGKNAADPLLAHWQTGLGKAAVWTSDAYSKWAANWVGSAGFEKFWAQVVRGVSRPPMSSDFDVKTVQNGDKGKIIVEALNKDSAFLNFLSVGGTVVGPDVDRMNVRFVQTGPGTYESEEFDASKPGTYVSVLHYQGQDQSGVMLSGMAVNSSPELRDLKSNDALLHEVWSKTGGRLLDPFNAETADLFTRDGLVKTASPLPIWDLMIPFLLAMIIIDVAVRRIAWDWIATKRMAASAADFVRSFTTVRKVEAKPTLDALKRVREEVAEQKFRTDDAAKPPMSSGGTTDEEPAPDRAAKFEAKGVEGDISEVVGGATNKPIPPPPKKIEPKGGAGVGGHTGSLLEAKRRAQKQIKEKEEGN